MTKGLNTLLKREGAVVVRGIVLTLLMFVVCGSVVILLAVFQPGASPDAATQAGWAKVEAWEAERAWDRAAEWNVEWKGDEAQWKRAKAEWVATRKADAARWKAAKDFVPKTSGSSSDLPVYIPSWILAEPQEPIKIDLTIHQDDG